MQCLHCNDPVPGFDDILQYGCVQALVRIKVQESRVLHCLQVPEAPLHLNTAAPRKCTGNPSKVTQEQRCQLSHIVLDMWLSPPQ